MTGIIIALYEEFLPLKHSLSFRRINGVGQYNGFLFDKPVSVYLCGPNLKHRSKMLKWFEQHRFSRILNIGFAGALRPGLELGQACKIKMILQKKNNPFRICIEKGEYLITVENPVFSYDEKEDLFLSEKAGLVDMEAYKIAETISMTEHVKLPSFSVLKIVGDLYGDAFYLKKEAPFRSFFTRRRIFEKLKIILATGLQNSWFLYQRKKFLQKRLLETVQEFLRVKGGGV